MSDRIEVQRTITAPASDIFAVLTDPHGHVAIDATGMLQDAEGEPVRAAGDSFVVHMDREALNDYPMGKWSDIDQHWREAGIFPVVSENALRATLGILDRTVKRGYLRSSTRG